MIRKRNVGKKRRVYKMLGEKNSMKVKSLCEKLKMEKRRISSVKKEFVHSFVIIIITEGKKTEIIMIDFLLKQPQLEKQHLHLFSLCLLCAF